MAIFMLDCDSVTSTASSINSLVTQFSQLADSVKGYDTSCEDGFDFSGAKSAIGANIDACTTKVQNTVKLVEGVVTSHTSLQNTFTIDQNGQASVGQNGGNNTGGNNTGGNNTGGNNNGGNNTGGNNNGGNNNSGGNNYGGGGGGGNNNGGGGSNHNYQTTIPPVVTAPTPETPVDVTKQVKEVSQVTVDVDKLDPANKTQFITGMTYNEFGYATYDNKYVIVCDNSLAKIGDNLVFTKPDGTKVDCIVGAVVDYSEEYKGTVSFIVNESWNAQSTSNLTFDINNLNVLNNGQYVKA